MCRRREFAAGASMTPGRGTIGRLRRSRTRRTRRIITEPGARLRRREKTFTLGLLARELARAANGFGFLARLFLGRLFVGFTTLHFAKQTLALHLLLQDFQRLVDVVVSYKYLQCDALCLAT